MIVYRNIISGTTSLLRLKFIEQNMVNAIHENEGKIELIM